jgi:hypothetical protein
MTCIAAIATPGVVPDFTAVSGSNLPSVIGAGLAVVLVCSAGGLVIAAICWAWGITHDNWHLARSGKTGLLIAAGTAGAAGAGIAWANWLIHLCETFT